MPVRGMHRAFVAALVGLVHLVAPSSARAMEGVKICAWDGAIVGGEELPPSSRLGRFLVRVVKPEDLAATVERWDVVPAPDAACQSLNRDTTPPELVLPPSPFALEATAPAGARGDLPVSAKDNRDGATPVACTPALGTTLPLGVTPVACTATDSFGNASSGIVQVVVRDTTPPSLQLPAAIFTTALAPATVVSWNASATDAVDGALAVSCTPASGEGFPRGVTSVSCSATDRAGNTGSGTFLVEVRDTTPPVLSGPRGPASVTTGDPAGAPVWFEVSATDDVDGSDVDLDCWEAQSLLPVSPGTVLAPGAHEIRCTATDGVGNTSEGAFATEVILATDPELVVLEDNRLLLRRPAGGLSRVQRFRLHQYGNGYLDVQGVNGQIGGVGYGTFIRRSDTEIEFNFDGSYLSTWEYWRTFARVTFFADAHTAANNPPRNETLFGGAEQFAQATVVPRTTTRELQSVSVREPGIIDFGGSRLSDFNYGTVRLYDTNGGAITFVDAGSSTYTANYFIANGTYLQLYAQAIEGRTFTRVEVTAAGASYEWDFPDVSVPARTPVKIASVSSPCRDVLEIRLASGKAEDVKHVWAYQRAPYPYSGWTSSMYFTRGAPGRADWKFLAWSGDTIRIHAPSYFEEYDYGFGTNRRVAELQLSGIGPSEALKAETFYAWPTLVPHKTAACAP